MCGGAAQSPEMIHRIVGELHLEGLMNGLGMTEASGSITRTRLDAPAEITASTIGHPMP